jgi:hypothetical protein
MEVNPPSPNEEVEVDRGQSSLILSTGVVVNRSASNSTNSSSALVEINPTYSMTRNSFWRVYRYNWDGDSVAQQGFVDIPYEPVSSACGAENGLKYQELDISELLPYRTFASGETLGLKFVIYSNDQQASLGIVEAALSEE